MEYLNTAEDEKADTPIESYHLHTPPEEYDLNCYIPLKALESNGVRLEPFIPSLHAEYAFSLTQIDGNEILYKYLPYGPFPTLEGFLTWLEFRIRRDKHSCLFLITDLSRPYDPEKPLSRVAGWIGVLNINHKELIGEIGHVTVLKRAWKTHVNTHASSLLLKYLLSARPEGVAFRHVTWLANKDNEASNTAAKRLGFSHDGTTHYARVLSVDKEGGEIDTQRGLGRPEAGKYRHTEIWSVTWEDWEKNGVEQRIEELLSREVKQNPAWDS